MSTRRRYVAIERGEGRRVVSPDMEARTLGGKVALAGELVFNGHAHTLVHWSYDARSG